MGARMVLTWAPKSGSGRRYRCTVCWDDDTQRDKMRVGGRWLCSDCFAAEAGSEPLETQRCSGGEGAASRHAKAEERPPSASAESAGPLTRPSPFPELPEEHAIGCPQHIDVVAHDMSACTCIVGLLPPTLAACREAMASIYGGRAP